MAGKGTTFGRIAATSLSRYPLNGGFTLPRKPNYKFERLERDRAKAAKKAARLKAKNDRKVDPSAEEGVAAEAGGTDDTVVDRPSD